MNWGDGSSSPPHLLPRPKAHVKGDSMQAACKQQHARMQVLGNLARQARLPVEKRGKTVNKSAFLFLSCYLHSFARGFTLHAALKLT